jgi:hypothetical protein
MDLDVPDAVIVELEKPAVPIGVEWSRRGIILERNAIEECAQPGTVLFRSPIIPWSGVIDAPTRSGPSRSANR